MRPIDQGLLSSPKLVFENPDDASSNKLRRVTRMKPNRICLLLAASLFTLFSNGRVADRRLGKKFWVAHPCGVCRGGSVFRYPLHSCPDKWVHSNDKPSSSPTASLC